MVTTKSSEYYSPYPQQEQEPPPGSDGGSRYTYVAAVVVSLLIVAAIVKLARCILGPPSREAPPADGDCEAPAEVVRPPGPGPVPVLCAYGRGDGWREPTCPVCLSDFAEGETVRVLPACMHYFHAACVGEWLRGNHTCPVCRAAPPPPVASGFSGQGHLHGVTAAL